jgi:murein peptide amidase A
VKFESLPSGISVEGKSIEAYKTIGEAQKYIYLMAGTHGDEIEGITIVEKLFEWFKTQTIDLPMVVIPVLNPDGQAKKSRVNANGVDLNRNYPSKTWSPDARAPQYYPGTHPLSEPENQFLDQLFKTYRPGLIMSIHSWKPMINTNGDCTDVAMHLQQFNGYVVCDDIEDHPTPGSLGEYGPQNLKSPVLTFECPLLKDHTSLEAIWMENSVGFQTLFQHPSLLKRFL